MNLIWSINISDNFNRAQLNLSRTLLKIIVDSVQ